MTVRHYSSTSRHVIRYPKLNFGMNEPLMTMDDDDERDRRAVGRSVTRAKGDGRRVHRASTVDPVGRGCAAGRRAPGQDEGGVDVEGCASVVVVVVVVVVVDGAGARAER